jgi:hypothetical protein
LGSEAVTIHRSLIIVKAPFIEPVRVLNRSTDPVNSVDAIDTKWMQSRGDAIQIASFFGWLRLSLR